jgi:hypothetical protein
MKINLPKGGKRARETFTWASVQFNVPKSTPITLMLVLQSARKQHGASGMRGKLIAT